MERSLQHYLTHSSYHLNLPVCFNSFFDLSIIALDDTLVGNEYGTHSVKLDTWRVDRADHTDTVLSLACF